MTFVWRYVTPLWIAVTAFCRLLPYSALYRFAVYLPSAVVLPFVYRAAVGCTAQRYATCPFTPHTCHAPAVTVLLPPAFPLDLIPALPAAPRGLTTTVRIGLPAACRVRSQICLLLPPAYVTTAPLVIPACDFPGLVTCPFIPYYRSLQHGCTAFVWLPRFCFTTFRFPFIAVHRSTLRRFMISYLRLCSIDF